MNTTGQNNDAESGINLAHLYQSSAVEQLPDWLKRHRDAVLLPRDVFERAVVSLLKGWLLYADAQQIAYSSSIGDDGVLGEPWSAIGVAVRGLLNGHLGRLDGGTLDALLCNTLRANGFREDGAETTTEESTVTDKERFSPGRLCVTPGAEAALAKAGKSPSELLARHLRGDWGHISEDDKAENELSLVEGFRLLSSYPLDGDTVIWVITEGDRSATTLLTPDEY